MGRRGPSKTPTHLRLIRGNPGKRPINDDEPQPARGEPDVPEWFDEAQRAEWDRVTSELRGMGLLHRADRETIAGYCEAFAEFAACCVSLKNSGLVSESERYGLRPHPLVKIKNDAQRRFLALADRLGLNPSARTHIRITETGARDPLSDFISKKA